MKCPACGTELIPGKQFCPGCGARAAAACPHCHEPVEPAFRFCPSCGRPLGEDRRAPSPVARASLPRRSRAVPEALAQRILASKAAIEGERKVVTVLFCDLVGSTAIAERLDPEEYHDLLEEYLALAFAEIYRFDGIVNQLAGDGLMALFGAPIAHEDAPERAVRAALAIRHALQGFSARIRGEQDLELTARVGIHTGPVVVGTVGNDLKMDYTAIGDTTNLASRLESLAQPGTILVSEDTHRLVRGRFEMRSVGATHVKGKSEPVVAYEVVDLREAATPMTIAEEHGLTPLVGRNPELAQLEGCFRQLAGGMAQVVEIVGEAGSGKSRLVYEFKRRLANADLTFFEARCSALNQMVAYHPWGAMLRQYLGIRAGDPIEIMCEKVAGKVRPWEAQLDHVYPVLCQMLALRPAGSGEGEDSATERKREQFEAMGKLIKMESERAPVVMIVEDLHWIDDPSREMLERAVAHLHGAAVMLVVTHRPEYQPRWHPAGVFTSLSLRRLSDEETTQIMRAVAGAPLPEQLERLVLAKAEGSPFFAEEITRALLEGGYLARENGHHRLTRPVEEILIPGTVQEVIAARLDRLGTDAKRVLQVAAVLGRQFSRARLQEVLADEGMDVATVLDDLERRGVVHRKNVFSTDEFRFGESLTQEVAYEGLLLKQRRQLHERIGLLLESAPADGGAEHSALLALHFARSDNRDKAVPALLQAARDAERVPAYHTATRFYNEAWTLLQPTLGPEASVPTQRWAIEAAVGLCRMTVIYNAADPDDKEPIVERARAIAQRLDDSEALGSLMTYQGMIAMNTNRLRYDEGLAMVEQGLAVVQRTGRPQALLGISRALAWSYLLDGRLEVAQRTIDWVVAEMEQLGGTRSNPDTYLGALTLRDRVCYYRDDLDVALQNAATTYQLAVELGNRTVQGSAASTLSQIHFVRAHYAEAQEWAERSWNVAQAIGNVGMARTVAAIASLSRLELRAPAPLPEYVEAMVHEVRHEGEFAIVAHFIVDALLALPDLAAAERFARRGHARAAGRLREMMSALALGMVLARQGPESWGEADRLFTQAIASADVLGVGSVVAMACIGAGDLARARGDTARSAHHLQHALATCQELGLRHYEARTQALLRELGHVADPSPGQASGM